MPKKTINLTESQLHALVEQALNELDWRTYMSAANKMRARHERGDGRRLDWNHAWDLANHAANQFNKEHNPSKEVDWVFIPTESGNGKYMMKSKDATHAFDFDPDNVSSVLSSSDDVDMIDNLIKGNYVYDKDEHAWRRKMPNGSIARRVTESVMRKLRETAEPDPVEGTR